MENKQIPSKKKPLSIHKEKLLREIDYEGIEERSTRLPKNKFVLDLEILHRRRTSSPKSEKVLVSIKSKTPAIKTLYIAEKSRFLSNKGSSRLAIGDHTSHSTHFNDDDGYIINSIACGTEQEYLKNKKEAKRASSINVHLKSSILVSKYLQTDYPPTKINACTTKQRSPKKCCIYTQSPVNVHKIENKIDKTNTNNNTADIALLITSTSSEALIPVPLSFETINNLSKRIDNLERKIMKQEMVAHVIDPNLPIPSSDDDSVHNVVQTTSGTGRPGCSYIQQYSHVPKTSAFQRYARQPAPLSPSKATTIDKEHNSEQYGRDFTAYDGITARGHRQTVSVPCKRNENQKAAAERVHKIRHKLTPVRDYRLMDTVHYLAQGEFAPRDDGIKLTPSREAVLSDIIWEDVCRTHWPNARLARRVPHNEKYSTRHELQRLIDSLLRERVAHVERRRRRHYRIVKLNHRHESCRPMGKTGDIIVASHKNREGDEGVMKDHATASLVMSGRRWKELVRRRPPRSDERLRLLQQYRHSRDDDNSYEDSPPGPSYATTKPKKMPTCCYHASSANAENDERKTQISNELTSGSSSISKSKAPRLIVKKDAGHRKHHSKDDPNLEHYILLPTLVVRTPSNVRRQKKFNELYHRILNVQQDKTFENCAVGSETAPSVSTSNPIKKDIGFNINITLSSSSEHIFKTNK